LPDNTNDFTRFLADTNAVKFGHFILKSGKESPVFFDFGQIVYGKELIELGKFFADFIVENSLQNVDVLFGPAYKGINIAIAVSIGLYEKYGISLPIAYNRKVPKDHAEGGNFVGFDLSKAKSVLILDDVFTDGGTKYEAINMLSGFKGLSVRAVIIGVDRQEIDASGKSYLSEFKNKTGINVFALTTKEKMLSLKN